MRVVATCLALLAFGAVLTAGQTAPDYDPNTAATVTSNSLMCQLDGLALTHGLTLNQAFSITNYHYTCACNDWSKIGVDANSPTAMVHLADFGSNAQIWFNGHPVNTKDMGNELTNNGGTALVESNPLGTSTNGGWVVGDNLIQILASCVEDTGYTGPPCPTYTIVCNKPPSQGGQVVGDPQFVGLRGQNYQVHGVSGEIYNIVSDSALQYNSRFVFLESGACPVVNGKKQKACWSHPGSYLGELGLKTRAGDKIHLVSGPAKTGFALVEVNGKELEIGETVFLAGDMGSVSRNNTHFASVNIDNWSFGFENSDMFVNQRVSVLDGRKLRSHGLLGQTWRDTTYPNAIKHIQGEVDDYVIRESDIFGDNFVYNAFN